MNDLILSIPIILGILKNAFKRGKFTCKNFILNAYLYIILSLLLISFSVTLYHKYDVPPQVNIFLLLFASLALLIILMKTRNIIAKHVLWLLWLGTMGYTLYPLSILNNPLFSLVKYQVLVVMGLLTMFTFWKPHLVSLSWGTSLSTLLIGLIIVQFVSNNILIAYFSFVLFAFFMLYDTKRLMVRAKQCVKADYMNDSLGIVLNGLNIFTDLFRIQSN